MVHLSICYHFCNKSLEAESEPRGHHPALFVRKILSDAAGERLNPCWLMISTDLYGVRTIQFWGDDQNSLGSLEVKLPTIWTYEKSRGGKRKRREEKRREEKRREEKRREEKKSEERVRRKKMQVRETVEKSRNALFLQCFVAPESTSRLAKAAGAEPSGEMREEKLHAVVARSTFGCQNSKSTTGSDHFWMLTCRKSACRCGAKHISKSKCAKRLCLGTLLEVEMLKKWTALWNEALLEVKMLKAPHAQTIFGRWSVVLCGRRKGFCTRPKVSKTWWFCSNFKNVGRGGTFEGVCKNACHAAGTVQETHESDMLGGRGADFLRRVAFWSIRCSGLPRWFCLTGAALRMTWPHFFLASAIL